MILKKCYNKVLCYILSVLFFNFIISNMQNADKEIIHKSPYVTDLIQDI